MRIFDRPSALAAMLLLASGCSNEPDNAVLAEVEADQVRDAAAAGRIPCALAGADAFRLNCTMERVAGADGETLVLGRPDAGYRRFRITTDGRGVIAADGADVASVTLVDDGQIEVVVATDRYRLPATVKGSQ
jgi:hypothetical protein